ncbi:hypothetical protein H5T88_06595 [bacterium]|nr:hypothetical protein [bacterium]
MGIGFSDNSFCSGIRARLSLRAFCEAEGVAISYSIIVNECNCQVLLFQSDSSSFIYFSKIFTHASNDKEWKMESRLARSF